MDIDVEDHELSDSESDQSTCSERSRHRPTNGYEICAHTCTQEPCISQKTNTIIWNKEGHSVRRHACSRRKHPRCRDGHCPAWRCLGKKASRSGGRDATDEEVALHLGIVIGPHIPKVEVPQMEVEDGVIDRTTINYTPTMAPGPSTGNLQMAVNRRFKIIYIPDAAMRIRSKEKAQNDLGFIPTVLSELEYKPLKHLVGSIHVISKCRARHSNIVSFRVVMQEWVSASIK